MGVIFFLLKDSLNKSTCMSPVISGTTERVVCALKIITSLERTEQIHKFLFD